MNYKSVLLLLPFIALGTFAGYYAKAYVDDQPVLYPKCITVEYLKSRIAEGWDINTRALSIRGKPFGVVENTIFDVVCGADPVVDWELAQFYLENGGQLSLDVLWVVLNEARRHERKTLVDLIEGRLSQRAQ
jgi:hypothetical protein